VSFIPPLLSDFHCSRPFPGCLSFRSLVNFFTLFHLFVHKDPNVSSRRTPSAGFLRLEARRCSGPIPPRCFFFSRATGYPSFSKPPRMLTGSVFSFSMNRYNVVTFFLCLFTLPLRTGPGSEVVFFQFVEHPSLWHGFRSVSGTHGGLAPASLFPDIL